MSRFIDGPIEIHPRPLETDIRYVQAPAAPRSVPTVTGRIKLRTVFDHPSGNRGVIHVDPALCQEFVDMADAQRIGDIPAQLP